MPNSAQLHKLSYTGPEYKYCAIITREQMGLATLLEGVNNESKDGLDAIMLLLVKC